MSSSSAVVVSPAAYAAIALHAQTHRYTAVHGILLGSVAGSTLRVAASLPVAHGAPTATIVETALGMLPDSEDLEIVGWYYAPMLLEDTSPSPLAMRMAANLVSTKVPEPALLLLQGSSLAAALQSSEASLKAYGKDFGGQWMQERACTMEDSALAVRLVQEAMAQKLTVADWMDHLEGPASTMWYPNEALAKLVSQCK